ASVARAHLSHHRPHLDRRGGMAAGRGGRRGTFARPDRAARRRAGRARHRGGRARSDDRGCKDRDANGARAGERRAMAGAAGRVRGRAGHGGGYVVEVTLIEASRRAALQEMRRDARVWVLGEDVARGGLWGQYKDFLGEFGPERVVSTPISESTIM